MTVNPIKDQKQREAYSVWKLTGSRGTIEGGTGFGKSRIGCLAVEELLLSDSLQYEDDILLVTPTTKLRDETWPEQFKLWGVEEALQYTKRICFASLRKEKEFLQERKRPYKLVIFDEFHRITELAAAPLENDEEDAFTKFSSDSIADAVMALTATVPDRDTELDKYIIMSQVAPVVFSYSLDDGVRDGLIADYEIRVIRHELDDVNKTIDAGTQKKSWKQTEQAAYNYMEKLIMRYRIDADEETDLKKKEDKEKLMFIAQMKRNRFLALLPSKNELAARCVKQISKGGKRTLIFGAGIDQIETLVGKEKCYHSKTDNKAFDAFNNKEINILGVVNAANEGINFVDLDSSLIIQVDSNPRNFIQRLGRNLRVRDGHKAMIYIIVVAGTADERWFKKSVEGIDPSKIKIFDGKTIPQ